jgi:hypothetical protein
MRFNRFVVLPLALLALGALPACSNDDDNDDDDNNPDSGVSADAGTGTDAGTGADSGTYTFPDAGADPGVSPTATCPTGSLICEAFDKGTNGWSSSSDRATADVVGGRLHILTADGVDESKAPVGQDWDAIVRWEKRIPAFSTQLFVRAHVYLQSLPAIFGQMGTFFVLTNLNDDFGGIELQVISDTGFALDDWSFRDGQGWNRQGPPVGLGMAAGKWVCLEWEVRRDSASSIHGSTKVYRDGALAHEFPKIGMRNFDRFIVGYGFVHPQGKSASEAWIDNVAVSSTARIGCQ